ncbi:multidrug resistance protein, FusA/NodT family [gut metagenome]|uniref:Multidrug resistance protein, FusA/NodT family n=1 Tax=gut metagenome TaxID=749906 RepID=J9GN58_9ZZZZ
MLLHEPSHPVSRGEFNADAFPASFSTGVPLQLLANRPDVRAAELQLASAFYGVNIARSAFYPSLTIGGQAGWTNNSGMGLVNPGKILASAFASLTQPIFANGKLMAQLKISKIDYEAAEIQFQETLLNAGQEVSNALALYQSAQQQQALRQQQVETLSKTLENTKQLFQYSSGTSYLETLTAQQSLIQAQLNLISDKFDKVQAAISLYQALGGGREQTNN